MIKFVPSLLKTIFWNNYFKVKYFRTNKIGRKVRFSRDTIIGKYCKIGNHVVFRNKVKIGNNVTIGSGAILERIQVNESTVLEGRLIITGYGDGIIKIGKESFIGHNTVLDFSDNITIGDFVHIGYSQFWTHSSAMQCFHGIPLSDKDKKYRPTAPIIIENNVYVGVHSTIYPGIRIGNHSIVAPNSAVTKDVEPYTMVGGVPAKLLKSLEQI